MFEEFKKFILKGNVVDLSTGVIIGAAFTGIVTAFTKGIVEPILALAGGGPQPRLTIPIMNKLVEVTEKNAAGEPVTRTVNKLIELDIGSIIGAGVSFLITASVVFFIIVKPMNKLAELASRKKASEESEAPPPAPADIQLLTEIRDLLKSK
ncbi:large conductance mechanosensitive channel protein MscL [Methylomagnum ishizawai]|uniref:large conductance mechanosensitive channel protein MscL n=1 Tax=Methylomagnum ishizawai TaxID=1760988 RepID=UPI001C3398A1|nr:large conductance mechanosensitive channel protein MscL [Methylomagnum ishizawai]BBL75645.1 large-conductance mechanosensitive channel [Methylomagnum ishizawai]